jgi:hypothetical protein
MDARCCLPERLVFFAVESTSKGTGTMSDYSSLAIGLVGGLVVFLWTVIDMRRKAKKRQQS